MLRLSHVLVLSVASAACVSATANGEAVGNSSSENESLGQQEVRSQIELIGDERSGEKVLFARLAIENFSKNSICIPGEQLPEGDWIFGSTIKVRYVDGSRVARKNESYGQLTRGPSFRYVILAPGSRFVKRFELSEEFAFPSEAKSYRVSSNVLGLLCRDLEYGLYSFREGAIVPQSKDSEPAVGRKLEIASNVAEIEF